MTTRAKPRKLDPREVVRSRNNGRCQLTGQYNPWGGCDWAHRVARGRGGSTDPSNGLWLAHQIHMATGDEQDLSRRFGWMVKSGADPLTVPALCIIDDQPGWWMLDPAADGCARRADWDEVEDAELDPSLSLDAALTELARARGWTA